MKILATGTLSGATGSSIGSGVSTPPIDLSKYRNTVAVGCWTEVSGDCGRTGGSIGVYWRGSWSREGTYAFPNTNQYLLTGGTSVSSGASNGANVKSVDMYMPWVRLEAAVSRSGVTNHGSGTTSDISVAYKLVVL